MRILNESKARDFFEDIIKNGNQVNPGAGRLVWINGRIVQDSRQYEAHAVQWCDVETGEWSVTILHPATCWAIEQDGVVRRFVNSLEYAMYRCGFA